MYITFQELALLPSSGDWLSQYWQFLILLLTPLLTMVRIEPGPFEYWARILTTRPLGPMVLELLTL
jgi:hypothetical protein